jgi:hypothetical protein
MKNSLAYKLIDNKIDEYINNNRRHTKSGSEGMSVLGRCLQRYDKCHNKVVPQAIEEGRLHRDAA